MTQKRYGMIYYANTSLYILVPLRKQHEWSKSLPHPNHHILWIIYLTPLNAL